MRRLNRTSCVFALLVSTGCSGKVASFPNGDPDAPVVTPDAAPVGDLGQTVTGKALDYFALTPTAVPAALVTTDGITPSMMATGIADGTYTIDHVPTGSKLFLTASHANYSPTRNVTTSIDALPVTQDVYVMATNDIKNATNPSGAAWTPGTGFFTADLRKNDGTPLVGVALADVKLLDALGAPVIAIPYFYNTSGLPDPAEATSAAYGTPLRARVAFVNLTPGNYQLQVPQPTVGGPTLEVVPFAVAADGATLAHTGNSGVAVVTPPTDPTFATDIYPKLQRAGLGGLGCANCHTAAGTAAVLPYDGTAADTLAKILAIPGVVVVATPATSLFLTKPLYELTPPQNHPNATFLDVNDADYKLFLLWITNGAKP